MITFKPIIIFGNRRKDGTWAVYIRVTFKGASRRVATPLVCTSADLTRSGRIKAGAVLDRAEEIVRPMRGAVAGLSPFDLGGMDVDGVLGVIRSRLQRDSFSLDFFAWADAYITNKTEGTRYVYDVALNAFARFLGTDKSVVDDALGHKGSFVLADIYAEKAWNLCWDACRKVLDLFHW